MTIAAAIVGLLYGLFCEWLAFQLAWGGHGWAAPLFPGALGLVAFPLSFHAGVAAYRDKAATWSLTLGFTVAMTANLWLLVSATNEGMEYFEKLVPASYMWVGLWLGGQLPLAYAAIRRIG